MTVPTNPPPFNIFLAWSGESSKAVAKALVEWLPTAVQRAKPWMSDNIDKGKRWREEVTHRLGTIRVGVLCLTPENFATPWLNFEAGALSRFVENDSRVVPYLLDLDPTAYPDPLAMFQWTRTTEDGTWGLVRSINAAMDELVADSTLEASFRVLWPALETKLRAASALRTVSTQPRQRSDRDILKEILLRVRALGYPNDKPFTDLVPDKALDEVILEYIVETDGQETANRPSGVLDPGKEQG